MMNDYWIKRVGELQKENEVLQKENDKLFEFIADNCPGCGHNDGSICLNLEGRNYGRECDCPWENDCYGGN